MNLIEKLLEKFKKQKTEKASPEYQAFISADLSKYKKGEYVLFTKDGVYSHGFDLKEMLKKFKNDHPKRSPAIFKIPPKNFIM